MKKYFFIHHITSKKQKGTEAVIFTIGPPLKSPGNPEKYRQAMEDVVKVLEKNKIKQYIHIGVAVKAGRQDKNWTVSRKLLRFIQNLMAKPIMITKE